jgi:hypothetical protein
MHALVTLWRSAAVLKAPQMDTQLLTFLIEMAALETEGAGSVRNIVMMTIELKEDFGALKSKHALSKWTGRMWTSRSWSFGMNRCGVNWLAVPHWIADLRGR